VKSKVVPSLASAAIAADYSILNIEAADETG